MSNTYPLYRNQLKCSVAAIDGIFAGCMDEAMSLLSAEGVAAYLDGASAVCGLGRGTELVLIFLENMPRVASIGGEALITGTVEMARLLSRTANSKAINPFLSTLAYVVRRLEDGELVRAWFKLVRLMAERGGSALPTLLDQVPVLLEQVSIGGLRRWAEAGLRGYANRPDLLPDWFSLQGADSRAAFRRERHGTLFVDHERRLKMFTRALWAAEPAFIPFSEAFDTLRKPRPFLDSKGIHLPDVYDHRDGVRGIDRYRAAVAHMIGHKLFTKPFIADNFNRFQHLFIEAFEDARVEYLLARHYPGLRRLWQALHPIPREGACPPGWSCIRHKTALLARALLDPHGHPYTDPLLRDYVERFYRHVEADPYDTTLATTLGVSYLKAVHEVDFRSPRVWFEDTEVDYRDDNRFMWIFLEDTDDEDEFHSEHNSANPRAEQQEDRHLFTRHHREWDYRAGHYQPDWVTVHEAIHAAGDGARIDALLERHKPLARKLKRIVEFLKPQQHVRERYQEEGDELDLDVALRALVDYRSGSSPDPRIHQRHKHDGRDIAVLLLLDLSRSINDTPAGADTPLLQLSQEAVALLAWAIDALGDRFAIAGFASNTRHEVHYQHFKGFTEPWGELPKARLAAMQGAFSTRMGAVLRHGGQYLARQTAQKRLLLLLTDGEPHDVDVSDPRYLVEDTRKAVEELAASGVASYCVTLDPRADDYVRTIFGRHYTVVDRVERLPERLPQLFMALTR